MKMDDILSMWKDDSEINHLKLTDEIVKSASLHSKYSSILSTERLKYKKLEQEKNKMIHLKNEYYQGNLDKETLDQQGWKQFQRKLLKTDVERFISADDEIIKTNLNMALQKEKVDLLVDIIKSVHTRTFVIKNLVEYKKFESGN